MRIDEPVLSLTPEGYDIHHLGQFLQLPLLEQRYLDQQARNAAEEAAQRWPALEQRFFRLLQTTAE